MTAPQLSFKELRRVVIAAAVGNIIEWYDFYIFGSLAILLASKFFGQSQSGANLIKYIGTFTAGWRTPASPHRAPSAPRPRAPPPLRRQRRRRDQRTAHR